MLEVFQAPAPINTKGGLDADPKAIALMSTLEGCCHPRAMRLRQRLVSCQSGEQFTLLQAEVTHLLSLSFGPAEATRRLQALH